MARPVRAFHARRWALIGLCAVVFAVIAAAVIFDWPLTTFDQSISDAVQNARTPGLDTFFVLVTVAGNSLSLTLTAIAIVAALLWQRLWRTALIIGAVIGATPLIVVAIKATVARARPIPDLYEGVEAFSFPSGHMTNTTVIIGVLALLAGIGMKGQFRPLVMAGLITLIGLVGASRIYLGAHWPSDVVAALMLGTIMISLADWALDREAGRDNLIRAFLVSAIAAVVIGVGHAIYAFDASAARYGVVAAGG